MNAHSHLSSFSQMSLTSGRLQLSALLIVLLQRGQRSNQPLSLPSKVRWNQPQPRVKQVPPEAVKKVPPEAQ